MKDNKGTTILLTVIGIATLLVAVVGATFAYFTAQVSGNNPDQTDVTVEAANLGTVTFTRGDTIDLCDDSLGDACTVIYPGATESKDFTITHSADSTVPVDYEIYLITTENSLRTVAEGETAPQETGNLKATLTAPTGLADGASATSSLTPAQSLTVTDYTKDSKKLIGTGTLAAGVDSHTWTLAAELTDTGLEQNDDQGRKFSARIVVEAATKYTVNGTEYTG